MKQDVLLLTLAVVASWVFSNSANACSELGKNEFTLDKELSAQCGALAQDIAMSVGPITFPKLKKGEKVVDRPTAPFHAGGLDPSVSKIVYLPIETLEKTKFESRKATFPITISSRKGAWECLYCVTFKIQDQKCTFEKISEHHCAGGVSYPSK